MIKFLNIFKKRDDNIFIPRRTKEEKDKKLLFRTYRKIRDYIKNGSQGDLDLRHSLIEFLPKNLTEVNGNLILIGCKNLKSLPNNLIVHGDFNLNRCVNLVSLPNNLIVNGTLDLEGCKNIISLPSGLKIKYVLDIQKTYIDKLPQDLEVGKFLVLHDTPLSKISQDEIRKMVPKFKGDIYL